METRQIEFEKLRHAYIVVKEFLETEGYEKVTSLNNKIVEDLGLFGDDNRELLEKFVAKFELDYKDFDYSKHFHYEGELTDPSVGLLNLLLLSIWLPLKTIQLLTNNKHFIKDKEFFQLRRPVTDMTFRDLLVWYIEREYFESGKIKYELKIVTPEREE